MVASISSLQREYIGIYGGMEEKVDTTTLVGIVVAVYPHSLLALDPKPQMSHFVNSSYPPEYSL